MTEAWLQEASGSMERLKWLVLRRFSMLPGDRAARNMTDADFVWCGLQMLLDAGEMPEGLSREGSVNAQFDAARFERLGVGA